MEPHIMRLYRESPVHKIYYKVIDYQPHIMLQFPSAYHE